MFPTSVYNEKKVSQASAYVYNNGFNSNFIQATMGLTVILLITMALIAIYKIKIKMK